MSETIVRVLVLLLHTVCGKKRSFPKWLVIGAIIQAAFEPILGAYLVEKNTSEIGIPGGASIAPIFRFSELILVCPYILLVAETR
eukprot:scaffold1384_cov116-Cylindrotheca_fusiformis.AAC.12